MGTCTLKISRDQLQEYDIVSGPQFLSMLHGFRCQKSTHQLFNQSCVFKWFFFIASSGILYLNTQSRKVPKGFQFGNDPKTLVLQIDEGMSKVKHYGVEIPLHKVEVRLIISFSFENAKILVTIYWIFNIFI